MKTRFTAVAALAAVAAAGTLAALALPQVANAWDWHQLPAGYSIVSSYTTVCHVATDPTCVGGEGSICTHVTVVAGNVQFAEADCLPSFQADLDAFISSTICQVNPAAGGSACAPTTSDATTQATTTAPDPATTTTTTTTVPDPAPTTTQQSAPSPPVTVTVADLLAQIDDLKSQIAALKLRVDRLEAAADAEWLSYHDAVAAGLDPIVASMVARQTGYDLIHGTGPFAP